MTIIFPQLLSVPPPPLSVQNPPTLPPTISETTQLTKHTPLEFHGFNFPRVIKRLNLRQRSWVSNYTNDYLTATEFGDDYVILLQQISSFFFKTICICP